TESEFSIRRNPLIGICKKNASYAANSGKFKCRNSPHSLRKISNFRNFHSRLLRLALCKRRIAIDVLLGHREGFPRPILRRSDRPFGDLPGRDLLHKQLRKGGWRPHDCVDELRIPKAMQGMPPGIDGVGRRLHAVAALITIVGGVQWLMQITDEMKQE